MTEHNTLSASEVALYDRQIRLWGVGAQARLSRSRVLIVHLTALAAEVVKNLVLAGVGHITVADDATVSGDDLAAGVFFHESDLGQWRVVAAASRIRGLNPLVELTTSQVIPASFDGFDIVVATGESFAVLREYNDRARSGLAKFYAAALAGPYGFIFADLLTHEFQITQSMSNVATALGPGEGGEVIEIKVDHDAKTETLRRQIKYRSLSQLARTTTDDSLYRFLKLNPRRKAKLSGLIPVLLALLETTDGIIPRSHLITQVYQLSNPPVEEFLDLYGLEMSPVAAILGGVLAQDVINVIGGEQSPIDNLVVFDSINNGIDCPIFSIE